ncbi:sigma-70 family RNA polymerase sigma factor [Amycolatopsis sp. BJA-103]|uniref:sigma-70 family RNA polymerase sigma factor n=1 Tax=Amycolatopsis sp. BJA-103 TaxID=1911175 RepID=UPI000C7611E7|nr:sigma-70 family RNA polymerase sigma factor [Amycolatopsis sp. BJA-103]AUI63080.1 RNA polymerase subunit sigma [Amycolatopsis sp. BJA-103]PNE18924.1 RNA polymerase subunit sigma [Amycolatopsis sp. BJA-103]
MWDVNAVSAAVLGVLKTYRLSEADARDVCQDAWLDLLRAPGALRDEAKLRAWLTTTARRRALRMITRNRRETPRPLPGLETTPETEVVRAARDRALWAAVDRLPDVHRRLMWLLAHRPELSYVQLAGELGISPASVGRVRRRCLDRLKRALEVGGWS